jgi:hypothetical protein
MRRSLAGFVAAGVLLVVAPAWAEIVTETYEAKAVTVVNKPFGLTVPLNTVVTGYFTFDTDTPDLAPADAMSGAYQHDGNAGYLAEFLTTRITGSTTPFYEVDLSETPDYDTFRIYDGPRVVGNQGGEMSIDGVEDTDIQLFVAVTKGVFDSDALINPFPFYTFGFLGTSHTFTLKDDQGTMLMQFTSVAEAVCGDPGGGGVTAADALQVLRTSVGARSCAPCVCDVDGNGTILAADALKTLRFAVGATNSLSCSPCL